MQLTAWANFTFQHARSQNTWRQFTVTLKQSARQAVYTLWKARETFYPKSCVVRDVKKTSQSVLISKDHAAVHRSEALNVLFVSFHFVIKMAFDVFYSIARTSGENTLNISD